MSIEDSKSPPNQIPLSFAIAFSWVHNSPAKTTSSSLTHNSMGHVIKLSQVDVSRNDGHPFYVTNFKANVLFGVSSLFYSPLWNTDLAVSIPLWSNR